MLSCIPKLALIVLVLLFVSSAAGGEFDEPKPEDVPVPSDDDLDQKDDSRIAQKREQQQALALVTQGLSTLAGASGSGGTNHDDIAAAMHCAVLGLVPEHQPAAPNSTQHVSIDASLKKRSLRISTSAPADPAPPGTDIGIHSSVPPTRRVDARTGDAEPMITVDDVELTSQNAIMESIAESVGPQQDVAAPVQTATDNAESLPPYYQPHKATSPAWAFFRLRRDRPKDHHFCQIPGCGATVKSKNGTHNLFQHLSRKHSLTSEAVREKAMQMRDHQPQSPSQSSAGASPSTPLTPGASQQHSSAAENPMSPAASNQGNPLAENSSPVPGNAGPTPTWHMLLPLDLKRQRRIAEAAVRNVLVPDMRPLNWLCTPGFQHFVDVSLTDFVNRLCSFPPGACRCTKPFSI